MSKPLMIAHRGDTVNYPENTLEAFLSAFEKGAGGIELDTHFHNGQVIVVHNYMFDKSREYPKLEEILEKIADKGRIEIEVKEFDDEILEPLRKILSKFQGSDFELATSQIPLAPFIKSKFPEIPLGVILDNFLFEDWMDKEIASRKIIGWGKLTKGNRLHLNYSVLAQFGKEKLVKLIHDEGFEVHSHIKSPEGKEQLHDLATWEIDQCTFDDINLVNEK